MDFQSIPDVLPSPHMRRASLPALPNFSKIPKARRSNRTDRKMFYSNKITPVKETANEIEHESEQEDEEGSFVVKWRNLSYSVGGGSSLFGRRKKEKTILKNLFGHFKSGQVMTILGPSGAGKSTLLNCIVGFNKKGMTGEIKISGTQETVIGIVPQEDHLINNLSVKETMSFAAKLRYGAKANCSAIVKSIINEFNLISCKNNYVQNCSGGQRKRLSIALEILAKPNILILDEPTTGLDSPSCTQVVNVMLKLTQKEKTNHNMAIVATIHQPSVSVFASFHQIYILSKDGRCAYQGSPISLLGTLSKVGLSLPAFHSPADFIIEVTAGDYGKKAINKLIKHQQRQDIQLSEMAKHDEKDLQDSIKQKAHPLIEHFGILFHRSVLTAYRNPLITIVRLVMIVYIAVSVSLLFGDKVGDASGCIPSEIQVYTDNLTKLSTKFETDMIKIMQNIALIFIGLFIGLFISLTPILLTFPAEMQTIIKEYNNGWYSCAAYYFSKAFTDLPFQVLLPMVYTCIWYNMTGQINAPFRMWGLIALAILMAFTGQSLGETVSAVWCDQPAVAVFAGIIIILPMILFGGFLVKVSRMPVYMQPLSWTSFLRFGHEAMLIVMYGFGRCEFEKEEYMKSHGFNETTLKTMKRPTWVKFLPAIIGALEKKTNRTRANEYEQYEEEYDEDYDIGGNPYEKTMGFFGGNMVNDMENGGKMNLQKSLILSYFDLSDYHIYRAIALILGYIAFLRIVTYYVLAWKLRSRK